MAPALGGKFPLVAKLQQRVQVFGAFKVYVAAPAAIAAAGAATGHKLFPPKRHTAVSAVATCYTKFGFVNEHRKPGIRNLGLGSGNIPWAVQCLRISAQPAEVLKFRLCRVRKKFL
jgi:hypothetical protein